MEIAPIVRTMSAIREQLRRTHAKDVARTDSAWNEFNGEINRYGAVDWATAIRMKDAFNVQTKAITAQMSGEIAISSISLWAGLISLALTLLAQLWLLRNLESAGKALQDERTFQTALLESLREGIVACDAKGTLTLFNSASREFHGLPAEPIPPTEWAGRFDLFHANGVDRMEMSEIPLFRALQGELVREAEMVIAPKLGDSRTILASGQPIYGQSGEKLGAVVAMHDITERLVADKEMARLAAIVESSEEAILVVNMDGIFVNWNSGAERVYGYGAADVLGKPASCLVRPGEISPVPAVIKALIAGEIPPIVTANRVRKDGANIVLSLSFSGVRNVQGELVAVSCISRDVTAQMKAKADLSESEERLRRLCGAAFEGITISQGGVVIDANPAFAEMFGYPSVAAAIGSKASELAAPESRELVLRMVASGDETTYEAVCSRVDGTTFPVEIRGRMMDWDGVPTRFTAIRDVTERKAMEEALRRSEARFRTAVDAMQEGFILIDEKGNTVVVNDGAQRILGLSKDDISERGLSGNKWRTVDDERNDFPECRYPAVVALATGIPQKNVAMGVIKSDSDLTWLSVSAMPLINPGEEEPNSVVITFADITERTLSEERFRTVFDHSSDAYMMFDENGILDCNAATVSMLRYTNKTEVMNVHPAVLSPEFQPDGRRSDEKCLEMDALARKNGVHRFEWVHRKIDGVEFPVEVTLTAITLQNRPVLLVVWHDLTKRKADEQRITDFAVALQFQRDELEKANRELESLATSDGLTGLKNVRYFQERLREEVSGAQRHSWPLSCILLDVDNFKNYNDSFGHPAGDDVLRRVAQIIKDSSRLTDIAARYGGEEFVLLLEQTDLAGALVIAERIRKAIESEAWCHRAITASLGVAELSLSCTSAADLVSNADKALYHSKEFGRNRVTASNHLAENEAFC